MNDSIVRENLIQQGILFPDESLNQNKLNFISGALATPFADMLLSCTKHSSTLGHVANLLSAPITDRERAKNLLTVLYDLLGMDMPDVIELISQNENVFQYFLSSFAADLTEISGEEI